MKSLVPEFVCSLPVFAASGLVIRNHEFVLVSDDEVSIVYGLPGSFRTLRLWDEELPEDPKARKKVKPDFESLFLDGDDIYVLPSFSRENRTRGARVSFNQQGPREIELLDLKVLHLRLDPLITDLNIEGALKTSSGILLFQRGNGKNGRNAVISLGGLEGDVKEITPIELPPLKNVPLTITDVTPVPGGYLFLAVAEATESTFLDGEIMGSVLGRLDHDFRVVEMVQLEFGSKPEGLALHPDGYVYFVTDDDSREAPSALFRVRWSRSG